MRGNSDPRIVIAGAGPGGLMAARVLQRGGLGVRVYDADGSAAERNLGGTLDLHADSGQIAMEDAGLTGRFAALARPEGQRKRLLDPVTGELLKEFVPGPDEFAAPEIDRGQLRALLADSVTADAIRWGRKLTGLRRAGDEWILLGMRTELGWLAAAGPGAHDGRGGVVLNTSGVQTAPTEAATETIRGLLLERFADFAPGLRRLIADSEGELANRPIFALPAPLTWEHVPGVTLVGDAAHVMSPFGGNGVNFALLDAAELARGLVRAIAGRTDADAAIREYENAMFQRIGPAAAAANEAIAHHYRAGGTSADDVPDFAEEARRWNENASAYRQTRGA